MVKKVLDAEEMVDVDVQFISLVSKPANKIPFRITKTEKTNSQEITKMLNFGSMLGKSPEQTQKAEAEVAAFVIREDDADKMADLLKAQGVDLEAGEVVDGRIVYKAADVAEDDLQAFQVSDDLVVVVSGVAKAFEPFGAEGSFTDKVKSSGVLPNLMNAADVMMESLFQTLDTAEAPADAVEKLEGMLEEFKAFVTTSVSELPASVFKIVGNIQHPEEATLEAARQVAADTEASVAQEVVAEEPVVEATAEEVVAEAVAEVAEEIVEEAVEAPVEAAAEEEVAKDEAEVSAEAEPEVAEEVAKSEEVNSDEVESESVTEEVVKEESLDIAKMISELSELVTEEIKSLKKGVTSLSGRLDEVEEVAKSADESMKGTALLRSDAVDQKAQKAVKPEGDFWSGVLEDL